MTLLNPDCGPSAVRRLRIVLWAAAALVAVWAGGDASATTIVLSDGRVLEGRLGETAGLTDVRIGTPEDRGIRLVYFIDDDLRRVFFPKHSVQELLEAGPAPARERFLVQQRRSRGGLEVVSVGAILSTQPFDEFGRRTVTMVGPREPIEVVQGITEITPYWTKVEGVTHRWDMRMATSSIPFEVLSAVIDRLGDPEDVEFRKRKARFFLQAERYEEALRELETVLEAHPGDEALRADLRPTLLAIRQLAAQRAVTELRVRRNAGQHRLVTELLERFPSEDVAGEILQEVRELKQHYDALHDARTKTVVEMADLLDAVEETPLKVQIEPILRDIVAEVTPDSFERLDAFRQLATDPELLPTEKLSLAISGWLLGTDGATVNLPTALSAHRVRAMVAEYVGEPTALERRNIVRRMREEEAANTPTVARLVAHMQPPLAPSLENGDHSGSFEFSVGTVSNEPPTRYLVQLPPEYDPYRRYPLVVSLHGQYTVPEQQIDWWAGQAEGSRGRRGQAMRFGYIVLAPQWTVEHQSEYRYSPREHAAVLNSLHDAFRRFSVDTERVYLSGHFAGGDAAWDIGLAHPDLWAGVIPISGRSDRYTVMYRTNAENLPFYVVGGEMDPGWLKQNARDLDHYLRRRFPASVVVYQGRGQEDFSDEIIRIFDWMGRQRREPFPQSFEAVTMRPWDNFFWWVEIDGLPPRTVVDPRHWPPPRHTTGSTTRARVTANNGVNIASGAIRTTVWLSPRLIDFERRSPVTINGRTVNSREPFIEPDLDVLLEDVRTRGDRQHPFWAKVEHSREPRS